MIDQFMSRGEMAFAIGASVAESMNRDKTRPKSGRATERPLARSLECKSFLMIDHLPAPYVGVEARRRRLAEGAASRQPFRSPPGTDPSRPTHRSRSHHHSQSARQALFLRARGKMLGNTHQLAF